MEMDIPSRLYKYREFNQFSLSALVDHQIWVPTRKYLNDPFEVSVPYSDEPATTETMMRLIQKFSGASSKNKSEVRAMVKTAEYYDQLSVDDRKFVVDQSLQLPTEIIEELGILSLSACYEKQEDILMWAHCAESHQGFIIGIDTSEFKAIGDGDRGSIIKVEYDDILKPININEDPTFFKRLGLKSKVWSYELEYRLFYPGGDCLHDPPSQICSITFGLKMDPLRKLTIRRALRDCDNIEFYDTIQPKDELLIRYESVGHEFFDQISMDQMRR